MNLEKAYFDQCFQNMLFLFVQLSMIKLYFKAMNSSGVILLLNIDESILFHYTLPILRLFNSVSFWSNMIEFANLIKHTIFYF